MKLLLTTLVCALLVPQLAAQEAGSSAAYSYLAGAANRAIADKMDWANAKKITLLKSVPEAPPQQGPDFSKASEGWVGDVSYWDTEVLSVKNDREMLLTIGKEVIWLTNYPTKDFTTGQKVRVVGPVKAGSTKSYLTTAGSERTVRTYALVEGKELIEYEENQQRNQIEVVIKNTLQDVIWGEYKPVAISALVPKRLRQYKDELTRAGRMVKGAKVNETLGSPIVYDPKKKRMEFDSEDSRALALDRIKSLLAELPK
jgi:hypothetical protein